MRRKFNLDLLKQTAEKYGAVIDYDKYNSLNDTTDVEFRCKCGKDYIKKFRYNIKSGMYCDICTEKSKLEKRKKTNLEKYGVEYALQLKDVQNKTKKTNLERYGVEHGFQSESIKEKAKKTKLKRYGVEHASQSKDIRNKVKKTNLERYGVEHYLQSKDAREKSKKANLERYGVEYPSQNLDIREKVKQTNLERYGVENANKTKEIQDKIKCTNLERYGVECVFQLEEVKEKSKKTSIKNYGVEHPMQHAQIAEKNTKSGYRRKEYTMPSGIVRTLQGYEHLAMDIILETYSEDDIITNKSKVPEIWYHDAGKKRRYYVDFYIPSDNKCIEVKSTWTYSKKQDNVNLKKQAVKEKGYSYELWIFDSNKDLVDILC